VLVIDPTENEITRSRNHTTIVFFSGTRKIPYMLSKGKVEMNELEKILSLNITGCMDIMKLIENFMIKEFNEII